MGDYVSTNYTFDQLRGDQVLAAMYCAYGDALNVTCGGICPNADVAGIGVRIAFYSQSIANALLVIKSPEDSAQGAWSATVLTAALIIPALIQKFTKTLTLYHATLVLNFSTISAIASIAVAPLCNLWRPQPSIPFLNEDHPTPLVHPHELGEETEFRPANKVPGHKGRVVLSVALLLQVMLQWAWVAVLFTSPSYFQPPCSGPTKLVLFGFTLTAHEINNGKFVVWPIWLLFSIGSTLCWGIILVFSSSSKAHDAISRRQSRSMTEPDSAADWVRSWGWSVRAMLPRRGDRQGQLILLGHTCAFLICAMYLISSEIQISKNDVLPGENVLPTFGQTAAILLAIAPAWALIVAFYKRPSKKLYWKKMGRVQAQTGNGHGRAVSEGVPLLNISSGGEDDTGAWGHGTIGANSAMHGRKVSDASDAGESPLLGVSPLAPGETSMASWSPGVGPSSVSGVSPSSRGALGLSNVDEGEAPRDGGERKGVVSTPRILVQDEGQWDAYPSTSVSRPSQGRVISGAQGSSNARKESGDSDVISPGLDEFKHLYRDDGSG